MRFFPDNITAEDAKKLYHKLARVYHPDGGGDEETFKILNDEYQQISKGHIAEKLIMVDDLMERARVLADACLDVISEMYPRTKIAFDYSAIYIEIIFYGNVPLEKMVKVLDTCQALAPLFKFQGAFERGGAKKIRKFVRNSMWILVDWGNKPLPDMTGLTKVKDGPRWLHLQSRTVQIARDKKSNTLYAMTRSPKLSLWELL